MQTQVLSKQLARARTLDRAAAAMQGNAKQKKPQANLLLHARLDSDEVLTGPLHQRV